MHIVIIMAYVDSRQQSQFCMLFGKSKHCRICISTVFTNLFSNISFLFSKVF